MDCTFLSLSTKAHQLFWDQYKHTHAIRIAVCLNLKISTSFTSSSHPHPLAHVSAQALHSIFLSHISLSNKQHLPLSHSRPTGTGLHDLPSSSRLNSMQLSAQDLSCRKKQQEKWKSIRQWLRVSSSPGRELKVKFLDENS